LSTEKDNSLDKLDRAIGDKRRELEQLREIVERQQRQAEIAAAELRALEAAAQMRPSGERSEVPRKGRQQGAISKEWREVLARIYLMEEPLTYQQITDLANGAGISVGVSGVRERMRRFVEQGFVTRSAIGTHTVTPEAVEKFRLSPEQPLTGLDARSVEEAV
jgi:hypothetical protein